MKTSTWLALGGLGALAYYLSRTAGAGASGFSFGQGTVNANALAGADQSKDFFLSRGDKWTAYTGKRPDSNLSRQDQANSEGAKAWLDFQASDTEARKRLFLSQIHDPASRIPLSALTAEDWQRAKLFLLDRFDRRNATPTEGMKSAAAQVDNTGIDMGALLTAMSVGEYVLDAFTFGLVSQAGVAISNAAAGTNYSGSNLSGQISAQLERLKDAQLKAGEKFSTDGSKPNPLVLCAAQGNGTAGNPGDPNVRFVGIDGPLGERGNGALWDYASEPAVADGRVFWTRGGIFAPGVPFWGWLFPWVSVEMGDKKALSERIPLYARMYRALDAMGAAMFPFRSPVFTNASGTASTTPDSYLAQQGFLTEQYDEGNGQTFYTVPSGLYAYNWNGLDLWGCVLPPHPDDQTTDLTDPYRKWVIARISKTYVGDRFDVRDVSDVLAAKADSDMPTPAQVAATSVAAIAATLPSSVAASTAGAQPAATDTGTSPPPVTSTGIASRFGRSKL